MPFVRIDFSSFDSTAALQQRLDSIFERLQKPSRAVCTFLGFRCDYADSKNRLLRSLAALHSCFIVLLSVFLFLSLVAHLYMLRHFDSAPLCIQVAHVLLYLQGFASFIFLLWWQKNEVGKSFHQALAHSTSGVGFVKHAADMKVHTCAFLFGCAVAAIVVARFGLSLFTETYRTTESPSLDYSLFSVHFRACLLLSALYFAFAIPAANSLLFACTSVVIAEFQAIDADFLEDPNTYQTAVTKHYINVHWRISRLWLSLRLPFAILFSLQILFHLLSVFLLAVSAIRSVHPYDIATTVVLALNSIVFLVLVFSFATVLHHRGTGLQYPMTALIAKERALQEQTYFAICVFNGFLQHSSLGVAFFELVLVDRTFVFGAVASLLLAAVSYFVSQRER